MTKNRNMIRDERGVALIITVIILMMLSAVAMSSLTRSREESAVAGTQRGKIPTIAAADAGLRMVGFQLLNSSFSSVQADQTPINVTDYAPDRNNLTTIVRTGTVDNPVPAQIERYGQAPIEGYDVRVGSSSYRYGIYRATVVATDPAGGNVQVQGQHAVLESAGYN